MSLISLWNSAGEEEEQTPMPDSFRRWVATDGGPPPENEHWVPILHAVEAALSRKIVQVDSRSLGFNYVLDVKYATGAPNIVRSPLPEGPDSIQEPGSIARFWREVHLMRWLKVHAPELPIPAIQHVIEAREPEIPRPIVVMDKMPGDVVLNAFGRLPYPAKERLIREFASQMLTLFRLPDIPQLIGTPSCTSGADGAQMDVIPRIAVFLRNHSPQVYATLEAYLASLVASKSSAVALEPSASSRERGERVLARLSAAFAEMCVRLAKPALRRCVLVHDDLSHSNVLVSADDQGRGALAGIIDWEYASVLPAVLAAEYPNWLRSDGTSDPAHAFNKNGFWMCSKSDAEKLREYYRQVVKAQDAEYHEALVEGEVLRNTIDWLTRTPGEGCAFLEAWLDTAFPDVA